MADFHASTIPNDFSKRATSLDAFSKYAVGLLDRANAEYEAPVQAKVAEFRESLDRLAEGIARLHAAGMGGLPDELARALAAVAQEIQDAFPPPDQAPGHERRVEMADDVLQRVEEALVRVAEAHGLPAERIREDLHDRILPHVKRVVVIIGTRPPFWLHPARSESVPPMQATSRSSTLACSGSSSAPPWVRSSRRAGSCARS